MEVLPPSCFMLHHSRLRVNPNLAIWTRVAFQLVITSSQIFLDPERRRRGGAQDFLHSVDLVDALTGGGKAMTDGLTQTIMKHSTEASRLIYRAVSISLRHTRLHGDRY